MNEPAFPRPASEKTYSHAGSDPQDGMTLRDYFAAKAMQGWLATFSGDDNVHPVANDCGTSVARLSYEMADLMLAERNKTK